MAAYYNEIEPFAAQWLRNLINARLIATGEVDTRSIVDVRPDDLDGFTQCHFFAGIGGWSHALRLAGWSDERPVWTGSCPCQPFSVAGKGLGVSDERHLWPVFRDLIRACRPAVVMGEQVAAAVGKSWLDGVFVDLEGAGYTCEAAVLPACAVDAPHRRDRLWFVADARDNGTRSFTEQASERGRVGLDAGAPSVRPLDRAASSSGAYARSSSDGDVADADEPGSQGWGVHTERRDQRSAWSDGVGWALGADGKARRVVANLRGVVDGLPRSLAGLRTEFFTEEVAEVMGYAEATECGPDEVLRAVRDHIASQAVWKIPRGFFSISEAEILLPYLCELERRINNGGLQSPITKTTRDRLRSVWLHTGSARPSQGWEHREQRAEQHSNALHLLSQFLARSARSAFETISRDAETIRLLENNVPARVGKLRALGNAIVPQVAAEVIAAFMECRP